MGTDDPGPFPYMRWAKAHLDPSDPSSLGLSGLDRPGEEIVPLPGEGGEVEKAWRAALAERYGVPIEGVHPASGSSHANFVTYLALARGRHVAVERPAYEALHALAGAVGATLSTFRRDEEARIDLVSLEAATPPGTALLVVTDLHNPSGLRLADDDLSLLVEVARRRGASLLVDEVYADFDPTGRPTAARRDPCVVATASLTKAHGLSELRTGWVIGHPDRIAQIDRWDDLVCPRQPTHPMAEALRYLPHLPSALAAARALAADRARQVDAWVATRDDVRWVLPHGGLTGWLRLGRPGVPLDGDAVARRLWDDHRVRIVPGSFFQTPDALRLSFGISPDRLASSLHALGEALGARHDLQPVSPPMA